MNDHLLPCFFCESESLDIDKKNGCYQVFCKNCLASGPIAETLPTAMTTWNKIPRIPSFQKNVLPRKKGWYFSKIDEKGKPVRVFYVRPQKMFDRHTGRMRPYMMAFSTMTEECGFIIEEHNDERLWSGPFLFRPLKKR